MTCICQQTPAKRADVTLPLELSRSFLGKNKRKNMKINKFGRNKAAVLTYSLSSAADPMWRPDSWGAVPPK